MNPIGRALRTAGSRLALLGAGCLLALGLAELVARVGGLAPIRFPPPRHIENADKSVALDLYPTDPRHAFPVDLRNPVVRANYVSLGLPGLERASQSTPQGVDFRYNSLGCRDRPLSDVPAGERRVLVLGDSFTEGQGVPEGETFARRLDGTLHAHGLQVDVVNCGRRGRDFPAMFEAFERLQVYRPDVVLYAMVLNDPVQSPAFRARQQFLNDWIVDRRRTSDVPPSLRWFDSRLAGWVRESWERFEVARATTRWYREMYGAPNAAGWAETQRELRMMDRAMRARGGMLLVAVLPLLVGLEGNYPFEDVSREIARACTANGLRCHDVLPAFRGRRSEALWVHPVDMHPNERAHAIIASDLAPFVETALRSLR